jgi:hypothetical protein
MKYYILAFFFITVTNCTLFAQNSIGTFNENNWLNNWSNFKPATTEYSEATIIISGTIDKNKVLSKKNTYLLVGTVYVINDAVLTIESGTVIRGDKTSCGTLVITKGAKILAEGTETDPIIFTSNSAIKDRKPGDWGGIILLGDAPINKIGGVNNLDFDLDPNYSSYGGQNAKSNSGVLKFVRIEYSGRKFNALKELNGLSMAGIGKETKIEYVQISFSNDDSFECYGGDIKMSNLISYRATDDDFDFTQGVQCKISNSLAIRNPFSSDSSGSRCFEIDSYDKSDNSFLPNYYTKVIANNITLYNSQSNNQGLVREAVFIKDKTFFSFSNSIVSGFRSCILLDAKIGNTSFDFDRVNAFNIQINQCDNLIHSDSKLDNPELSDYYAKNTNSIVFSNLEADVLFIQPDLKKSPDFRIKNEVK